jgi:hypothetical protein
MLIGVGMFQSSAFEGWLGWPGIIIGLFLIVGSLEFVGGFEEQGRKLAGAIVPIPTSRGRSGSSSRGWYLWSGSGGEMPGRRRAGILRLLVGIQVD